MSFNPCDDTQYICPDCGTINPEYRNISGTLYSNCCDAIILTTDEYYEDRNNDDKYDEWKDNQLERYGY